MVKLMSFKLTHEYLLFDIIRVLLCKILKCVNEFLDKSYSNSYATGINVNVVPQTDDRKYYSYETT